MSERAPLQQVSPVEGVREDDADAAVASLPDVPTASMPAADAKQLERAVAELRAAPVANQPTLAHAVNELLGRLHSGEAEGRLLLSLLAEGRLIGFADATNRSCRAEAVRALLRLGFPWALEIEPETLSWFRGYEQPGAKRGWWVVGLVLATALGAAAWLAWPVPASTFESTVRPVAVVDLGAEARQAILRRWEQCQARTPDQSWPVGRVDLRLTLDTSGAVDDVTFSDPSAATTELGLCLLKTLSPLRLSGLGPGPLVLPLSVSSN